MADVQCSVGSMTDTELIGRVACTRRRLVLITPGLSMPVAQAVVQKWRELGPWAVHIVMDPDPEVCRLGFGELDALELLFEEAAQLGTGIHQQKGLRVGVLITDESTAIYSPAPLLVEGGGRPGERANAILLDAPLLRPASSDAAILGLSPTTVDRKDFERTREDLKANPPVKFDLARKVRVFNAAFEFVEFELHGAAISRKTVPIPADLMGLAKDPATQRLLRASFKLVEDHSELSGRDLMKLKQEIENNYLITLPHYGSVILRSRKPDFLKAVGELEQKMAEFQKRLREKLEASIKENLERLVVALLPAVAANRPARWNRYLADAPREEDIVTLLRNELGRAFGSSDDVIRKMQLRTVFKGVTYESLINPGFVETARRAIPTLDSLFEQFEAARAVEEERV